MPGRAFDYMNQNLGLVQSGLASGASAARDLYQLNQAYENQQRLAALQEREQKLREEQFALQRDELVGPVSDVERWVGSQLAQIVAEGQRRVEAGEDPIQVAKETKVRLLMAQQGAVPSTPSTTLPAAPSASPVAPPASLSAPVVPRPTTVQLPEEGVPGMRWRGGPEGPRYIQATQVSADGGLAAPPQGDLFLIKQPEVKSGPPEVRTRRDLRVLTDAADRLRRLRQLESLSTPDQRMELEMLRQLGGNYRAGLRAQTAEAARQTKMDIAKLNNAMRARMFWQSTSNIDNALKLLRDKYAYMEKFAMENDYDKNLRTQLAQMSRIRGDIERAYMTTLDEMKVNPNNPNLVAKQRQLRDQLWQLDQFINRVNEQLNPQGGVGPFIFDEPKKGEDFDWQQYGIVPP